MRNQRNQQSKKPIDKAKAKVIAEPEPKPVAVVEMIEEASRDAARKRMLEPVRPRPLPVAATEKSSTGPPKVSRRRLSFRELKTEKHIRESRMTVWRRIQEGLFPKPFVDHGRTYWWENEIDEYQGELANLPRGCGNRPACKAKEGGAS